MFLLDIIGFLSCSIVLLLPEFCRQRARYSIKGLPHCPSSDEAKANGKLDADELTKSMDTNDKV
jgi:hypothetical protein